ncbi:MAG: hypothetical protein K8U57_29405 [Planctomycetes bacterium]|nr:hypothetical protein [Planctomycetota bacterium]
MTAFERDGITFHYPASWRIEIEDAEDGGWAATVSSPDTAFMLVSLRPDARDPADLADQTLAALQEEYEDLEVENRLETIAGQPALGHDLDFITLDVPITCRTRSLGTLAGPLLLMCQTSEFDRERNDPVLRAIVASLRLEE